MKRLIVKACGNSPLEEIRASIEARVPYAQFHQSLESFRIISFDIPDENIDQVKGNVNDCGHRCFWDTTIELDPIKEEVIVEDIETEVSLEASQDTTWATSAGGQYRWFRVVQWDGQPVFEYSFDQSTWYKPGISIAGGAGYTFYFRQNDSSNTNYPLRLSTTPDGIWNGGVEYTGSNWNAGNYAPGSSSHQSNYSFQGPPQTSNYTPPVLYPYCPNQPGMYRYQSSPARHGSFSYRLNAWHLDRISKKNRSALNNQYTYTQTGDGVDLYIIDSGVRGASRPTGSTAALHPELYDPDNRSSLTGTSEQGDYRVYELSNYSGVGNTNEDDNGHGTNCAILASGWRYGIAKDIRIYSLKAFNSNLGATFSDLASAYQAVIDHNNPSSAYYKGNNRPAIINASFGATTPSGSNPIIELNDSGTDYPYNELEILDEIESTVSRSNNIIICRSAGNGFISASDTFLGPLQAKFKTGARTGGPKDLRFNAEDFDQPKIVVGATEPGDNVADFSNYGNSVDVYAPGQRIVCPDYEWSANTSYGSGSTTYDNISGTSFSTPIVAGIIATWLEHNGYDATTSNLPQKAKDWIRTTNAGHRTDAGRSTNYPLNLMDERELVSNPFSTTNASSLLVVKFNPADAGYFIGKVGKKVQIRTPSPIATIVGNINLTEALRQWWGITAEDALANSITIDLGTGNVFTSTNTDVGGSGPFSMGIITDTHQETDGPHFGSVSLTTRTDAQEANNTGTGVGTGLPVDAGYFDPTTVTFTSSVNNGAIFPFVEKTFTWDQAQGTISQSPIAHGSVVNINLGYSSAVTSGGETVDVGPWTISGDSLIGTNLIFNTSTGYLQSSASSSYFQDTSFNVTVTDTSTGNAQTYNFILTASGVNNIRSHTGGSPAVPGNFQFTNQCSSELDKYWKVNPAIDGNWTLAFQPGNAHLNDPSMQNGTKAYGNHTFGMSDIQMRDQAVNKKPIGFPPVPHQWTDQTPPPRLNYTMSLDNVEMRDQTINKKAIGFPPVPHIWTQGPLPGSLNYTLTYLNPTVYISPGRPFALLNNGQIFPRFFDEVDEIAVPANTASGAFAEIDHYDFLNGNAITDACYLNSSREFLKDKRPRTGLLYPRGNTYRPPEN
tara:strand:+ start:443 stop:3799 length:3357 start_codon:yes stop_codon:yes gene_type:complete